MTNDPIEQYLSRRAESLEVGGVGAKAVAARARRRRTRRNAGLAIAATVVLLAGGAAIVSARADDGESVRANASGVVPSELAWTTVDVTNGMGGMFESGQVELASGTYRVSTGPGSPDPAAYGTRLYRTGDGVEWSPVELPDGFQPSAVAGDTDGIYAVGTAPAGGGVTTRLLSSTDGASWAGFDLSLGVPEFPGAVRAVNPSVARLGSTTVIAVTVSGDLNPAALPGGSTADSLSVSEEGVEVFAACAPEGDGGTTMPTMTTMTTTSLAEGGPKSTAGPAGADGAGTGAGGGCENRAASATYTWDELGLSAEQARLALGETVLLAADGDAAPVVVGRAATSYDPRVVAGTSGAWLVQTLPDRSSDTLRVVAIHSADGHRWDPTPIELGHGFAREVGNLAGTPTVAMQAADGSINLVTLTESGPRVTPVNAVLGDVVTDRFPAAAAFGPLGFVLAYNDRGDQPGLVAHSADGSTFSIVELPVAPAGTDEHASGVSVSPDAITVRLNRYPRGESSGGDQTPPQQRAFIGTPQ